MDMVEDTGLGVVGVVLAGGRSSRMGGGDKCLSLLGGRPMLSYVIERVAPQCNALVINANGDGRRFQEFELPVVSDTIDGFAGPLAGILAGMVWAAAKHPSCRWITTVSADAPFVPLDLIAKLRGALAGANGPAIALAASNGTVHPVIGLWPVALAGDLQKSLEEGVRKVVAWTDRHGVAEVPFSSQTVNGRSVDPFFNVNTPEDLVIASTFIGG